MLRNYPGFITIIPKTDDEQEAIKASNTNQVSHTNLALKKIAKEKLPYHGFYTQMKDDFLPNRQDEVTLLLRSDHVQPYTVLSNGGFQPHGVENDSIDSFALDPQGHAISSENSGMVSCTYSMDMIKNYDANCENFVYMVKATGAFANTNPRKIECEYTVPGGIDAEDIVAFRQLRGSEGYSNDFLGQPLYIRESFLRRYPELIHYILNRFLEKNESCSEIDKILDKIPGKARNMSNDTISLDDLKKKIALEFQSYIDLNTRHKERAEKVMVAIHKAPDIDTIWHVLNNQYYLFKHPLTQQPQGSITIFGLPGKFTSDREVRLIDEESYIKLLENVFSMLPRFNLLPAEEKKLLSK